MSDAGSQPLLTIEQGIADYQVFQRGTDNTATIEVVGVCEADGAVWARVEAGGKPVEGLCPVEVGLCAQGALKATLQGVPVGGPYTIKLAVTNPDGTPKASVTFEHLLVGDLWLLAGQSNMEGVGNLDGSQEEPSPLVNVFRMRYQWDEGREPVHRLWESPDPVHTNHLGPDHKQPTREEADKQAAAQAKGAGLGLPFAKRMVEFTGVPVGLVPTGHGGTSMDQWSPDLKDQGGNSLYGSMSKALQAVGGKVAGVLWYQGESDANGDAQPVYKAKFTRLIESIRTDVGNPDMPFYWVQLGPFAWPEDPTLRKFWNAVQEDQRALEAEVPNTFVVAANDLALDDLIHVGTAGHKQLGLRFAQYAAGKAKRGPRLAGVERFPGGLRVVFKEVNGKLLPETRVWGFNLRLADGSNSNAIYKTLVDPERPNCVLLYTQEPAPADWTLWYGWGLYPACNLHDEAGMAALTMGPIALPE